jgi:hypothetical protein
MKKKMKKNFKRQLMVEQGAWICFGNTVLECGPDSRAANCWGKLQMSENEAPGIDAGAMFMIKLQMDRSSASSSAS